VTFTGKILTVEAREPPIAAATHFTILIPTRTRNDYHDVYEKKKKEKRKKKMKKETKRKRKKNKLIFFIL
jgi:hypothetical protein